ncbi:hypothetical protein PHMEG_00036371 [Phytophthora megakarya]|uniref:Reverse transcriptase n=1 Tax=Phytophthora megakarya TaxID=4795 RepID=A0A225UM62_9STRA|nr:hypothetical protein PHMEG_00036371 [Phytophthora megakarya]
MDIQGISKEKATTTRKTTVKITLGWERVYVFDMWVIDHCAGVDVLLGTDFMIPAGVRLDMFHSNAKLPDEVSIPLIKTQAMKDEPEVYYEVSGYVRLDSVTYTEWQVLAYAEARDKDLYKKEEKFYEQCEGSSDDSLELEFAEATPDPNSGSDVRILEKSFISVVKAITTKGDESAEDDVIYVHETADIELTDYAQELAFLPDFSDHSPTELDFSAANVLNYALLVDDQAKLVSVLKTHKNIMIASGNALPPPAYGVVCDINVEDHAPIKQRARRIPIRYLQKLYELLKGLLKTNLVSFSDSQWASPIVLVLKKNGEDIRLCIDYKMVNAVTPIMDQRILGHNDET